MTHKPRHTIYWESRRNPNYAAEDNVYSWHVLDVKPMQHVLIRILEARGEQDKAVDIEVLSGGGWIECNGLRSRQQLFWIGGGSRSAECVVNADEGRLTVLHATRIPRSTTRPESILSEGPYWGMKVLQEGQRTVYCCNNGRLNDDFDYLVFSIEMLE